MADDWLDIDKIKIAMKKAAGEPIPFAFGVATKAADCKLAMYIKRDPEFLRKMMKKEGFKPAKIIVGTARTEGALLIVTCEAEVPNAKKFIKAYLKETPLLQKKVQLMGPEGEFDADDAEDEAQEAVAAAPAAAGSPDEDQATYKRRFGEVSARVKKFAGEQGAAAKPVIAKFKQAHTLGQNGEFGPALSALDELEELLEGGAKASPQADALAAEWSKRLKEIAPQIKEVLTAKLEGSRDVALKFKEAQGFAGKKDLESAIATLDEVSNMIESLTNEGKELEAEWTQRVKKLAPQIKEVLTAKLEGSRDIALKFKEAQGLQSKQDYATAIALLDEVGTMIENLTSETKGLEAEWTQRFKALEPDLESVLKQNLGDPSKLRTARDMAIEKADGGDHATALKILDRLQSAVATALSSAKPSGEDEAEVAETKKGKIAPSIAFTHSRLAWNSAREKIQADLVSLEKAILDAAKDEEAEIFTEIKSKTSNLYDILGKRNENLMDKLDEGYKAEKDSPAQLKAYDEAGKLVKDYVNFVNGSPLVQEIDSNPFKAVAVKKTLDSTLKDLAGQLAA